MTTKDKIIKVAYRLFTGKGYSATSIRDIAKGCEISLGAIYGNFQSKLEIFSLVIKENNPLADFLKLLIENQTAETLYELLATSSAQWLRQVDANLLKLIFIDWIELNGVIVQKIIYNQMTMDIVTIAEKVVNYPDSKETRSNDLVFIIKTLIVYLIGLAVSKSVIYGKSKISPQEIENSVSVFLDGLFV